MACLFLLPLADLLGDTIALVPTADTTLYATLPDYNLGAIATLIAGTTFGGQSNRALLRFDVTAVPPEALIESVTLSLTVTRTIATSSNLFRLHRMRKDWAEGIAADGNSGDPANAGETTWGNEFFPDVPWSSPGAAAPEDYATEASAEQYLSAEGSYDFGSSDRLVEDVNFWRTNASANFGWLLECADEGATMTSRRIASRESLTNAPTLTIRYLVRERFHLDLPPAADTSLFEYQPSNNLGASELAAGSIGVGTNRSRALVRFDLEDELPTEAIVTAARLRLTVTRVGGGPGSGTSTNFSLHRLLVSWGEGNKIGIQGAVAEPGEATWYARFWPDLTWSQPGAAAPDDYVAAATDTTFIGELGPWVFTNLISDVQFWAVHPETNFGWILVDEAEDVPRTARRFASRESSSDIPLLQIEYLLPPHIDSFEVANGQATLTFAGLVLNPYTVEWISRLDANSWSWITLTNVPPPSESGPITVSVPAPGPAGFYRVRLNY